MVHIGIEINNKKNRDGRQTILLRITIDRKHKRISLPKSVFINDFNSKAKFGKWIRNSDTDHQIKNDYIKNKIKRIEKITHCKIS